MARKPFQKMCDPDEDETLFLLDTAFENGLSFYECLKQYDSIEAFLRRDRYIPVRGTIVGSVVDQEELDFKTDIDGITIEWENIALGLKSDFRHLDLLPRGINSLNNIYSVLKKHLDLTKFNAVSKMTLKECIGTQIIYDGQYETWIGIVPKHDSTMSTDSRLQRLLVFKYMEQLRGHFQNELRTLVVKKVAVNTLAKNNINDAKKMFVLPGDQIFILECLQRALDKTGLEELSQFRTIVFTFRFGEKCRQPVPLPVRNLDAVKDICVHAGHVISCSAADLFWSREGLRAISGGRGRMTSAFSFSECANFQTLLEGRRLDVIPDLKNICSVPENIRFIQLYTDLPHRYPKTRVHPVSASVLAVDGIFPENIKKSMYGDSIKYLSEIHNNFFQCREGVCRLEFVVALREAVHEVDGASLINEEMVKKLIASHPVIVPFLKGFDVVEKLRDIGIHIHDKLKSAFFTRRGTGDVNVAWDAFQCELAVEKLLWGHPMCGMSRIYSTNLGPGLEISTRCKSDQMGFLCLEESSACCTAEDTLPPLDVYTKNKTMQQRITNSAGIVNHLDNSEASLGKHLIEILLKDFHTKIFFPFGDFVSVLRRSYGPRGKRIVGGITLADLVQRLSVAKRMAWPMTFCVVRNLLRNSKKDIEQLLKKGINELMLGYFPAFRQFDDNRNAGLTWEYGHGYWILVDIPSPETTLEIDAAELGSVVISVMEKMNLCHSSQYRTTTFPWIKSVLQKIAPKNLCQEDKVKVLVFVSCVALIEQGRYVDFRNIGKVVGLLPISQPDLQSLEVLSKFTIVGLNTHKVYRLHPSIPFHLDVKKRSDSQKKNAQPVENQPHVFNDEDIGTDRIDENTAEMSLPAQILNKQTTRHIPSNLSYTRWSPVELNILQDTIAISANGHVQRYREYQKRCREIGLPDRSFIAYKTKLLRVTESNETSAN